MYQIELLDTPEQIDMLIMESDRDIAQLEYDLTIITRRYEVDGFREATLTTEITLAESRLANAETEFSVLQPTDSKYQQRLLARDTAALNLRKLQYRAGLSSGATTVERTYKEALTQTMLEMEREYNDALKAQRDTLSAAAA